MKKIKLSIAIISISLLHITMSCQAQSGIRESKHLGWLSMGLGSSSNGFLYGFNANYQYNRSILSVQLDAEVKDPRKEFPETTSDFSVLYGYSSNTDRLFVARLLAGVGMVSRTYFEEVVYDVFTSSSIKQNEITKETIGFPIRAELMLNGKFVAFGLTGLANINNLNTYTGLLFTMQIGLMR